MSSNLYTCGLWRSGEDLVLKDGDLTVSFHHAKLMASIPESEIDFGQMGEERRLAYYPEVREHPGDKRHEMGAPEIAALEERIAHLTAGVRAVFGIPTLK